jgi:hypothetical protein
MTMLAGIEKFIYDHLHPRLVALETRVAELEARVEELVGVKPTAPVNQADNTAQNGE